jgi:hypothetical protein
MIIITFDVIALPGHNVALRQPSVEGLRLWNTIQTAYRSQTVLLAVDNPSLELLTHWLKTGNYKPSVIDISRDAGALAKRERLQALQAAYGRATWYVDTDPDAVAYAVHEGIPSLLLATPQVDQPDWGVEKTMKSWSKITDELESQALIRAETTWKEL